MIPTCIWWTWWKERNARGFEDKFNNMQKIKMNCLCLLYFWCKQDRVGYIFLLISREIVKPLSLVLGFCWNGALWVVSDCPHYPWWWALYTVTFSQKKEGLVSCYTVESTHTLAMRAIFIVCLPWMKVICCLLNYLPTPSSISLPQVWR